MEAREAAMVEGLRRREPGAFSAVYAAYEPRVFRFLHRLAGRRDVAEDLFQETWIKVARSAGDLAPDTDLGAWIFTIARNSYRSYRRWALLDLTRIAELGREPSASVPSPEKDADARARAVAVERALGQMSAAHREVLLLATVEGLEPVQVAAVLGLSPEATRQRLHRARAELAEKLAPLDREDAPRRRDIEGGAR